WTQNDWDGVFPTKEELDAIAPNHPIFLTAKSLHMAWVNSAALNLANITNDTPNPKDGAIERDASGHATGILFETAMGLVSRVIPEATIPEIEEAIERAQSVLWKMGITGIHDFDR